jgi:hypothetical protein
MKVKIKDKLYDSDKEPILVIVSPYERLLIQAMAPAPVATYFCRYPKGMADDRVNMFMGFNEDEEAPQPYKEPPTENEKELALKLAKLYNEHVHTLGVVDAGCCGRTQYAICNQGVLLRILLEGMFNLTSDEACDLIHS